MSKEELTVSSNNSETKTRKSESKQDRIKTIRRGAIAATVWRRQTPTGFEYLDFSLSRSWKLKNGEREGYSQNFFETNQDGLFDVIEEACEFIRQHDSGEMKSDPSSEASSDVQPPLSATR